MWRARFYNAVPRILSEYSDHRFVFLTLTVRNCAIEELSASIELLNSAFKKLTKRKQFPAIGWLKAVEVTRNEDDSSAHPHLHVLLMVPGSYFKYGYISQANWRELWKSCLGVNYLPILDVRTVKPKPGQEHSEAIRGKLAETLKYTVKPSHLIANQQWLIELTKQLYKKRMIAVGGVLRAFINEEEPDDLIHPEGVDELSKAESELWFNWRREYYRYRSCKHD